MEDRHRRRNSRLIPDYIIHRRGHPADRKGTSKNDYKMKRILILTAAAAAICACSKTEVKNGTAPKTDGPVPIEFNAGVPSTKAPITNGSSVTAGIAGWQVAQEGTVDFTAAPAWNTTIGFTANSTPQSVTWTVQQYYPSNGDVVYMRAWYPAGPLANNKVTFENTDGSTDAMLLNSTDGYVSGSKTDHTGKNLPFGHCTAQIKFSVSADATVEDGTTLEYIRIQNTSLPVGFDLTDNSVTATSPTTWEAPTTEGFDITDEGAGDSPVATVMIMPMEKLVIEVGTSATDYEPAEVAITNDGSASTELLAGTAYDITINITRNEITLTASVEEWKEAGSGEITLD